ncbi:hypothetical protein POF45_10345 [Pseudomonas sp. 681]|uniref:Uncharacterized protein n=1 Tax=Pseudomonas fungipugnans TaxID=3024217 RepID=A0ABT6QLS9_9PSED|nr:hypothetical protein [Pseudomonas sp. 681]MDI2591826.1 hypothetical protein [Pseudomonas sp. 681]
MVPIGMLVFFAASAGIWSWIVRNRGSFSLWLANLAGFLASLIVGTLVLIFMGEQVGPRGPAYFLYAFMAIIGAFVGTWLLVVARSRPDAHPVGRHLIGGSCGLLAACITLVLWAVIFPAK